MTDPLVLVEKDAAGLALVTLNRPTAMNALSRQLRSELADAIDGLEADRDIRVLVLTGAGRAFCAGLDLKELAQPGRTTEALSLGESHDPVRAIERFSGPVIAAINGVAITGGFELALACDVLIASTAARFADTHARVGVMPGWGLSQRLSRAIGLYRAKELSLTGNFLSAEQAERWGLVNRVVPPERLLPDARAMALDMLSVEPGMLTRYKRLIDEGFAASFGDGLRLEAARARAANVSVDAGEIGKRNDAIRARGQSQAAAKKPPASGA